MKLVRPILHLVTDRRRHLVCLPYSVRNLHLMAAQIGIGRHWFHRDHYDLPVGKRVVIENNALLVSPKSIVRLIHAHNNPARSLRMAQDLPPQVTENHDHEARLALLYKEKGHTSIHFCPSWHYMVIHDKSPEFDACQCDLDALSSKS